MWTILPEARSESWSRVGNFSFMALARGTDLVDKIGPRSTFTSAATSGRRRMFCTARVEEPHHLHERGRRSLICHGG